MFKKPITVIKLRPNQYLLIIRLSNRVFTALTGNASYLTPNPTLTALMTAITDVQAALDIYGSTGNRGSREQLIDLRAKTLVLYQILSSLAQYVQNIAQTACGNDYVAMTSMISTSGFDIKNPASPQGVLQAVQKFRRLLSRSLNQNQGKLKWDLPMGVTSKNNVHSYSVWMSTTADFSTAVEIAETTKTSYIDTNLTSAPVKRFYWVVALGAAGAGAVSEMLTVTLAAA